MAKNKIIQYLRKLNTNWIKSMSGNKIKMKCEFYNNDIISPNFTYLYKNTSFSGCTTKGISIGNTFNDEDRIKRIANAIYDRLATFKIIIKRFDSYGGKNIYFTQTKEELIEFLLSHVDDIDKFVFEKWHSFIYEYRVQVLKGEHVCTTMKKSKSNITDSWHKHKRNAVFYKETSPNFIKTEGYNTMIEACEEAAARLGLNFVAFDVLSNIDGSKYLILESNTKPALGNWTLSKYEEKLKQLDLYPNINNNTISNTQWRTRRVHAVFDSSLRTRLEEQLYGINTNSIVQDEYDFIEAA